MSDEANMPEAQEDSNKSKRGKASKKGSAKEEPVKKGSKKGSAKEEPVKKGSKKGSAKEEPVKKGSKKGSAKAEEPEEAQATKKRGRAKADDSAEAEKKGKTSKKGSKKGSAKDDAENGERKSTRERKVVAQFVPAYQETKERTIVVPEGSGQSLGDIDNVNRAIDSLKAADSLIKKIHSVLFGQTGVKATVKKHVRQFNGIPKSDADEWTTKTKAKLGKMEGHKDLKPMCRVFDLETSGTNEDAINRIVEFLVKPKASGGEYKGNPGAAGKRKKASSKKSSSKKSKKEKGSGTRKASGFLLFSTTNRPLVKAKDPELSFGDLGRKLGKLWGKLSDSEKATWTEKAQKQANAKGKSEKPAKKKSKKAKESSSEESDSDSSESEKEDATLGANVEAKIAEIVNSGDLAALSVKKIKVQLAAEFGNELVADKGDQIKKFVGKCVAKRST
jgi:hypothetical protein